MYTWDAWSWIMIAVCAIAVLYMICLVVVSWYYLGAEPQPPSKYDDDKWDYDT